MNEKPGKPPQAMKGAAALVAMLLLSPLLYVLSVGPAAALVARDMVSVQAVETVYYPVGIIVERSETARSGLNWYLSFWVPDSGA